MKRLRLRPLESGDLDDLAVLYGDARVMRFSLGRLTREQTRERLEKMMLTARLRDLLTYAVELLDGNRFAGICGLAPQVVDGVDEVELGYRLTPGFWGRGIATEAALACRRRAFEVLRLPRLISIIEPANRASIRVAEKAGLRLEKETRKWERRVLIYAASRFADAASDPSAVR